MCPLVASGERRRRRSKHSAAASPRKAAKPARGTAVNKARRNAKGLIQPNIHIVTRDPLRVQILSTAMVRAISTIEFAEEVEIPYGTASYHFRVLRDSGFL